MTGTPILDPTEFLERGWFIFPIKKGEKTPCIKNWENDASDQLFRIREWQERFPGCNWGVALGRCNLTVVDMDPRNGGLEGMGEIHRAEKPFPQTLTCRTQSGGLHYYFEGRTPKCTVQKLAKGIDTKSSGGYVVLPGSVVADGGSYAWMNSLPIKTLPSWIGYFIGNSQTKCENSPTPLTTWDQPLAILNATSYLLKDARIDIPAYQVACQVRDYGVSEEICQALMWEHYAPRCVDPWPPEALELRIEHAYRYGQNQPGVLSPDLVKEMFPVIAPEISQVNPVPIKRIGDLDFTAIPKRQWLLGRRYLKSFITVTIAMGGMGKSMFCMAEAAAVASGRALTGDKVYSPGKVWIYNTEDPQDELDRRFAAISYAFDLSPDDRKNIITTSGLDYPLILVQMTKNGPSINTAAVNNIIQIIRKEGVVLWIVDPFVRAHRVNENDNEAIDKVAFALSTIASKTGCAVGVVHHTSKTGNSNGGDPNSARGASALVWSARIANTLTAMSDQDAKSLGIAPERVPWYLRLDDAKGNLAPPGRHTRWFERISLTLPNGDAVGVVQPFTGFVSGQTLEVQRAQEMLRTVHKVFAGPIGVHEMAVALRKYLNFRPNETTKMVVSQLIELLGNTGREFGGFIYSARLKQVKKVRQYLIDRQELLPDD